MQWATVFMCVLVPILRPTLIQTEAKFFMTSQVGIHTPDQLAVVCIPCMPPAHGHPLLPSPMAGVPADWTKPNFIAASLWLAL